MRASSLLCVPLAAGYWFGLAGGARRRSACGRILTFHATPPARARELERQLRYLRRQFEIVSLARLVEAMSSEAALAGKLALTFDDGWRSNVQVLYPILQRLRAPATFFVCPQLIDERRWLWNVEARQRLRSLAPGQLAELARETGAPAEVEAFVEWMKTLALPPRTRVERRIREASAGFVPTAKQRSEFDLAGWDELRSLDPSLVTIGSHTLTHPILSCASAAELEREVGESRARIEARLDRPVDFFCYPNGTQSDPVRACVARHYRAAVTGEQTWVRRGTDVYLLPRVDAPGGAIRLCWDMHRVQSLPCEC